jgi:Protein of unknown function (DUF3108)
VVGVGALHLWGAGRLAEALVLGDGAAKGVKVQRIDVAFVQELQQAAPAPQAPPRARARPRRAAPPLPAASAPEPAPTPSPEVVAQLPTPPAAPADAASAPELPASQALADAAVPAPAASAPPGPSASRFEWPPSTRLSYALTGNYQGPVHGEARVEWLRRGGRYQVHLDVSIGPSLTPFVTRRMSSEGDLTDDGLHPLRYEETTKAALRSPRVHAVVLDAQRVLLANGKESERPPGVQDTASQFVQLTWLFTTQPQRLKVGEAVDFPLALPRRLDRWTYDVHAEVMLDTPAGQVPAFHLKPRQESRREGELLVDAWIAPTLQYLPVRIRIQQDEQTWADLLIDRLPQQAAEDPDRPASQAR